MMIAISILQISEIYSQYILKTNQLLLSCEICSSFRSIWSNLMSVGLYNMHIIAIYVHQFAQMMHEK